MRVRIRQHPLGGRWYVESKTWRNPLRWQYVEEFWGEQALERAKEYAERLVHPVIVEVK